MKLCKKVSQLHADSENAADLYFSHKLERKYFITIKY